MRAVLSAIPAAAWMKRDEVRSFGPDALAGLTLAAYMLPAAIGDASLAQLPPEAGLYACLFSGLVFWLFCGSRHTSITVTSAISLLIGTTLGEIADGDTSRFGALAAATACLVGVMALLAWLVRAGSLVTFVSETVLIGFKAGIALTLASTQVPKLLGISGAHGGFWECSGHLVRHFHEWNPASAATGAAALAALWAGKALLRNKPVGLVVVIGGVLAAGWLGLGDRGVRLLGEVPQGLPRIGLPRVGIEELRELLPLSMACFLLSSVETAAIGRMFAAKHGERFDANQEFAALAGANLAAGFGAGFPVSGGLSQSLVNESGGARSPLSTLIASVVLLVVALFFSGALHDLPQPVLAAIVLMAIPGLVKVRVIRHLWRVDRQELIIAGAALGGVLASGLLQGVLIGAVISLLLLVRRAARPHVALLGRIPGTRRFSDLDRHPDNEATPGVMVFRPEGSLVYFNSEGVHETIVGRARGAAPAPGQVVIDLSAVPIIDLAGAEMLRTLAAELHAAGIRLHLVEARSSVRDRLRAEGIEERPSGRIDRFTSVADLLDEIGGVAAPNPRA